MSEAGGFSDSFPLVRELPYWFVARRPQSLVALPGGNAALKGTVRTILWTPNVTARLMNLPYHEARYLAAILECFADAKVLSAVAHHREKSLENERCAVVLGAEVFFLANEPNPLIFHIELPDPDDGGCCDPLPLPKCDGVIQATSDCYFATPANTPTAIADLFTRVVAHVHNWKTVRSQSADKDLQQFSAVLQSLLGFISAKTLDEATFLTPGGLMRLGGPAGAVTSQHCVHADIELNTLCLPDSTGWLCADFSMRSHCAARVDFNICKSTDESYVITVSARSVESRNRDCASDLLDGEVSGVQFGSTQCLARSSAPKNSLCVLGTVSAIVLRVLQ